MKLKFRLDGMTIKRTDGNTVVSDSQEYLEAEFTLASEDWQPPITALFGDYAVLLDVKNSCLIPWEAVKNAGSLTVSAFCGKIDNDNYLHTANCCTVEIGQSCYKQGETPKPPTPDVYQSILNKAQNAENVAQSVRDDADAGKFDGADGANGVTFTPHIEPVEGGNALSWTNDGGKPNPETVTIKDGESVYCDNQPKHTATGELIALDDVYPVQPLALGVEGKTVKDETGLTCVESAEIEMAGKNLLSLKETGIGMVLHWWGNNDPKQGELFGIELPAGQYVFSINTAVDGLYAYKVGVTATIASSFNANKVAFTLDEKATIAIRAWVRSESVYSKALQGQLEVGSTATPYEPYHLANLPIDLQFNKLCSLPDGVRDELRITREGERGHVELAKRVAENMETALPQPQTIDLGYIDLPTLPAPSATVWTSSNLPAVTSSVEYVQDINVVLSKLMQAIVAVPAMI